MTTKSKGAAKNRAVLSVHTKPETREKLDTLARASNRTKSALANEAIEQYVAHQDWLISEISRGIEAADHDKLVADSEIEDWLRSVGVKT